MPPLVLNEWIAEVKQSLERGPSDEQPYPEKRSIYTVPARITKLNGKAYRPQAVSFGPYHHDEGHLHPMEVHKRRALLHFLRRSRKPFETFLDSLGNMAEDLEESYDALDQKWKKDTGEDAAGQFLQLMITDGCFMLEILRFANDEVKDYAQNDPIFSNHGKVFIHQIIRRDMLLLENQLPMLVLDKLVALCDDIEKDDEYINRLILRFTGQNNRSVGKCLHVLDVFRKNLVKQGGSKRSLNNACMGKCLHVLDVFGKIKDTGGIIPPATELHKHGIKFKRSGTDSLTDISFASGVLSLPMIVVDDTTEPTFLNLIAFERTHVGAGAEVASYICLMDVLIDKGQDFELLCNKGIIKNDLESVDAAAKLFNSLAKDLMLDSESSINDVITKVGVYCERRWHKWRANLKHTYLRNPWVILSLIAAFVLFVLTIIQTVYAGLSYQK